MEFITYPRTVELTSSLPDVVVKLTTGVEQAVAHIEIDDVEVYRETLYGTDVEMDGTTAKVITLSDLGDLVTPYARRRQTVIVDLTFEQVGISDIAIRTKVVYCKADIVGDVLPAVFLGSHFLSILMGKKMTALGRLEYLHYVPQGISAEQRSCTALYSDDTTEVFDVSIVQYGDNFRTIDVSPGNFLTTGKTLVGYTITVGNRVQEFELDLMQPDCAPILIFVNSFGLDELAYCTGTHKVDPSYKRSMAYVGRIQRNYKIDETRNFKADTGPLTIPMANWWDDVFRSDSVRIVNFYDGHPNVGKDLIITESKSAYGNDDDEMPRFSFTYQYAQRNHNVVQLLRAGRIFDNTFDKTFN